MRWKRNDLYTSEKQTKKRITNSQWLSHPAPCNCLLSITAVILDHRQPLSLSLSRSLSPSLSSIRPDSPLAPSARCYSGDGSMCFHSHHMVGPLMSVNWPSHRCRLRAMETDQHSRDAADRIRCHLQFLNISPPCLEAPVADRPLSK